MKRQPMAIGWREWVALPDLGVPLIKAKVDTGARTSSLHAWDIRRFLENGREMVAFTLHPVQRTSKIEVFATAPIVDEREIRSSNGVMEKRIIIKTRIHMGEREWNTEISLGSRIRMGFRLILGRRTLQRRVLIDPSHSYLLSKPDFPLL